MNGSCEDHRKSGWLYYRVTDLLKFLDLCLSFFASRLIGCCQKVVVSNRQQST
jgi:hypothetical protein